MEPNETTEPMPVEDLYFENRRVSVCVLVDNRARSLRIIDFRAGPHVEKRDFLLETARARGITRVYALVEREEIGCWARLGLHREGNIPGFYKRSDAYVLGAVLDLAAPDGGLVGSHGSRGPDFSRAPVENEKVRVYQEARKLAKAQHEDDSLGMRTQPARPKQVEKLVAAAVESGRALTSLARFGRDVVRNNYLCTGKGGFSLLISVESQACYSNAFLEVLTAPRTEHERDMTRAAIAGVCDELEQSGTVSCFSLAPADQMDLAVAFLQNGFKRTGHLPGHLWSSGARQDAVLWSRKLAILDNTAAHAA